MSKVDKYKENNSASAFDKWCLDLILVEGDDIASCAVQPYIVRGFPSSKPTEVCRKVVNDETEVMLHR